MRKENKKNRRDFIKLVGLSSAALYFSHIQADPCPRTMLSPEKDELGIFPGSGIRHRCGVQFIALDRFSGRFAGPAG